MKIIKPNNSDPIPLYDAKPSLITILIRFAIFLAIAIVVLLLAWWK